MYREMLREKWEAEQRELLDKQETVHYANVRFDGGTSLILNPVFLIIHHLCQTT